MSQYWDQNIELLTLHHPMLAKQLIQCGGQSELPPISCATTSLPDTAELTSIYLCLSLPLDDLFLTFYESLPSHVKGVFIIEKDINTLAYQLQNYDYTRVLQDDRIHFLINMSVHDIILHCEQYFRLPDMHAYLDYIIAWPNFSPKCAVYYDECIGQIKQCIGLIQSDTVYNRVDTYHGFINCIDNADHLSNVRWVDGMRSSCQAWPAILIGAGPSLTRRLDWIKQMSCHTIIIAADSAYPILKKAGIIPHFICVLERIESIRDYFDTLDTPANDYPYMVVSPLVSPRIMSSFDQRIIAMNMELSYLKYLYPRAKPFSTGLSVTNMGYELAVHLGCHTVYLVGQDFAYDANSELSHADGFTRQTYKSSEYNHSDEVEVQGNNGDRILSHCTWKRFLHILNHQIYQADIPCINIMESDSGAIIPNARRVFPEPALSSTNNIDDNVQQAVHQCQTISMGIALPDMLPILTQYQQNCDAYLQRLFQLLEFSQINDDDRVYLGQLKSIMPALIEISEKLQHDSEGVYMHILAPFVFSNTINLAKQHFFYTYSKIDEQKKLQSLIPLFIDWIDQLHFWCGQVAYTIVRKKDDA